MKAEVLHFSPVVVSGSYAKATYMEACGVLKEKARQDVATAYTKKEECGCPSCNRALRREINWHLTDLEGNSFAKAIFRELK